MAKARKIVNDQSSASFDHLQTTVNNLILMLETAAASITAGATAEQVLSAWAAGIAVGTDSNPSATANIVSTGLAIEGQWSTPQHPRRPYLELVDMTSASGF